MKVSIDNVPMILAKYVDAEIMPKVSGMQKAVAVAISYAATRRSKHLIGEHMDTLKMLGLLSEDGMLDMDYARGMALEVLDKSGGSLHAIGYIFDKDDVEAMYAAAMSYQQGETHVHGQV